MKILIKEKKKKSLFSVLKLLLLQDASSKLGFSPKQTNSIAQELKDGIGSMGALITYLEPTPINENTEVKKPRQFIKKNYGENFISK